MDTTATTALSPVENKSTATRLTKEGRRITYVLEVVQKPERARACGQGAKCETTLARPLLDLNTV